ncbi:MAG TPA: hypothetical protein VK490_08710, partial [Gaiellaceae bacterium]|nr:hypothetical protein [Gaiellaceae bacterium]
MLAALPPPPAAPIPRRPALVAQALFSTTRDLGAAVDGWSSKAAPPPKGVVLFALYQQRLYRLLASDTKLAAATLPQLAPSLRRVSADLLAAHRELYRLTPP